MDNRPIAFFDSGVGGLPYLGWAKERLPRESFVYLADTAHFPYGEKEAVEVRRFVLDGVELVIRVSDPKMVVVACNTASVVALSELRNRFRLPFVGVVPALKPAAERSPHRRIALIATNLTAEDGYTDDLVRSFAADCEVVRIAERDLVRFVEYDFIDSDEASVRSAIHPIVDSVREAHVDSLVLACTHFTLLDTAFKQALGESVAVVDSREGVGRQIMRLLKQEAIEAQEKGQDRLYLTGEQSESYLRFAERYGLTFSGKTV